VIFASMLAVAAVVGVVFMVGPSTAKLPALAPEKKSPPPAVVPAATADPAPTPPAKATDDTEPPPSAEVSVKPADAAAEHHALLPEGRALYDKGLTRKAMVPLEKAVALKADGDEALVVLANCHLDRGALDKSLAAAHLAAAANAENADAFLVIGAVQQQKDH